MSKEAVGGLIVSGPSVAIAMLALELALTAAVNPDCADDAADALEHLFRASRIRLVALGLSQAEIELDMRRRIRLLQDALRAIDSPMRRN